MKLLLIEDEQALQQDLKARFEAALFVVDTADNAEDGRWLWENHPYALVLLDLGLPGGNGLELLRARRAAGDRTPVLILTARNAWQERVEGLQAGADDYLGKPFYFEELLARVQALLRRHGQQAQPDRLTAGPFTLVSATRTLETPTGSHTLTAMEFRLLWLLMRHPGQVFSKPAILERIADQHYDRDPNIVEVYVRRLRRYLGRETIETLRGQGYRFRLPEGDGDG